MEGLARMASSGRGDDSSDHGHEIIHVPNKLRAKVSGGTEIDPQLIENAEDAIVAMAGEFRLRATQELEKVHKLVGIAGKASDPSTQFEEIFGIVHDLKGQGSTFGYTLLTRISESLCRYIGKIETASQDNMTIIIPHVDALRAVLRHDVHGDDDPIGAQLVEGLKTLRQRAA